MVLIQKLRANNLQVELKIVVVVVVVADSHTKTKITEIKSYIIK